MEKMITEKRLEIYRHYGGDIDGLLRMKRESDLLAFGSDLGDIWAKITSVIQDIALIHKGLTSKEYAEKAIKEIKELCNEQMFKELMDADSDEKR